MGELLYDALMLGRNKKVAEEEYLVAREEKKPARFELSAKKLDLKDVVSDRDCSVTLVLKVPGYLEIEVTTDDRFISFEKNIITSDDFTDGKCEFRFTVKAAGVHNGMNFGRITFRTMYLRARFDITVNNKIRTFGGGSTGRDIYAGLAENYLELRLGRISPQEWQQKGFKLLYDINGDGPEEIFFMLSKAHIYITVERYEDAKALIEYVASLLVRLPKLEPELEGFFYYLRSLYEMDDAQTEAAVERLRGYWMAQPTWHLLWLLFYMDTSLASDDELKIELMSDLYGKGLCSSPIMYYEALCILKKHTELIDTSPFIIRVLNFSVKYKALDAELAERMAELILQMNDEEIRANTPELILNILRASYREYDSSDVLRAILRILIATDCRDEEMHVYFLDAIRGFIEVDGLPEYFIFTSDKDTSVSLPRQVLEYFKDNQEPLAEYKAYFYRCVIDGKYGFKDYYKAYQPSIDEFAASTMQAGQNGRNLSTIYRDILDDNRETPKMRRNLFDCLHTREVRTQVKGLERVFVFHEELNSYQEADIENGKAYIKIFSPNAIILFKDRTGNLYYNIDYEIVEPIAANEYIDRCICEIPMNPYLLVGDSLPILRSLRDPLEVLDYLLNQMGSGQLRPAYEQKLLGDMIMYFSKNSKDSSVYDELLKFMRYDLDASTRGKLIEIMIERGLYDEALEEIKESGMEGISSSKITELAHVLAQLNTESEDDVLLKLCRKSFAEDSFDPAVFTYLSKYYQEDLDVLLEMYRAARAYTIEDCNIEERIVRCAVKTDSWLPMVGVAFEHYYSDENDRATVEDYLKFMAHRFLGEQTDDGMDFFAYIGKEYARGTKFDDMTAIAYLLFLSGEKEIPKRQIAATEELLRDLCARGIMLQEFKDLERFIEIPSVLSNSAIVSTRFMPETQSGAFRLTDETVFGAAPVISYDIISPEGLVHKEEPMNEIFPGCFTKYFTLFYGEKVRYSIEGGDTYTGYYEDIHVKTDSSRYAKLDEIIRLQAEGRTAELNAAAKDYFVMSKLIEKIF